jgi:hypothetical protein
VPFPFSDLTLARRLEQAERASNTSFVEGRALVSPEIGAGWIGVGATYTRTKWQLMRG